MKAPGGTAHHQGAQGHGPCIELDKLSREAREKLLATVQDLSETGSSGE